MKQPDAYDILDIPGHSPDDVPYSTDENRGTRRAMRADLVEPEPSRSSTRAYTTQQPQRRVRVTRHEGQSPIQRASRLPVPVRAREEQAPKQRIRLSWKMRLIGLFLLMVLGWILVSIVLNTIHTVSDNLTYGNPRTFHADKDVGHGGLSHFTAENVGGHILVIEVVNSDPSTTKTYAVITIAGENAALAPATLAFEDKNGDGQLDMMVLVNNSTYVWPNDGKAFKEH